MKDVRFFKPFVGENYNKGINGKKVLVVGASFYCTRLDCKFFDKCTDVTLKDSSPFNSLCIDNDDKNNDYLSVFPTINIQDHYRAYTAFSRVIGDLIEKNNYDEIWSYMAFTNYVQFFLPAIATKGKYRKTYPSDLSERDFAAFNETLKELEPDIVVIWGKVINDALMLNNKYLVDKGELENTGRYICQIKLPDSGKNIKLINPYHPTAWHWRPTNKEIFINYLKSIL